MGTEKRERQRANKALKEQQVAKAAAKSKSMRLGIIVVGAIVAVIVIALAANAFVGDDDDAAPADDAFAFEDGEQLDAVDEPEVATDEPPVIESSLECPPVEGTDTRTVSFAEQPPYCLEDGVTYTAEVVTNKGELTMALDQAQAPITVNNFVFLARNKYYDGITCHRIIPGFVIQCGDPDGTGAGGPGYQFADELPAEGDYQLGSLAMANSGPDTNGSQFFIITGDQGQGLPPLYSLFGEVSAGFDETVKPIEAAGTEAGTPTESIVIESVTIVES